MGKWCLLAMWLFPSMAFLFVFCWSSFVHFMYPGRVATTAFSFYAVAFIVLIKSFHLLADPRDRRTTAWSSVLFGSLALAICLGVGLGDMTFGLKMRHTYMAWGLKQYSNIDPGSTRRDAVMDAGLVHFSSGTYVDTAKAMGLKGESVWCVAPIVKDSGPASARTGSFDFWAVGKDCCSGEAGDFGTCLADLGRPSPSGLGAFLVDDDAALLYRSAVTQAAASSNIIAEHPLLYNLIPEGGSSGADGAKTYFTALEGYFAFQAGLVLVAKMVLA